MTYLNFRHTKTDRRQLKFAKRQSFNGATYTLKVVRHVLSWTPRPYSFTMKAGELR